MRGVQSLFDHLETMTHGARTWHQPQKIRASQNAGCSPLGKAMSAIANLEAKYRWLQSHIA